MNSLILIIASSSLLLDQSSKIIAFSLLKYNISYDVIKNFFYFTLNKNFGAAFGILSGNRIILILIAIAAIIFINRNIFNFKKNIRNNIAFGILLGGIAGNLIDRIVFGYVRDFMDIRLFKYYFPIFNISDALVVMGTILLIISVIKGDDIGENKSSKRLYKSNKNR